MKIVIHLKAVQPKILVSLIGTFDTFGTRPTIWLNNEDNRQQPFTHRIIIQVKFVGTEFITCFQYLVSSLYSMMVVHLVSKQFMV